MDIMSWSNSDRYVPMLVKFCFVCSLICGVHVGVFLCSFCSISDEFIGCIFRWMGWLISGDQFPMDFGARYETL